MSNTAIDYDNYDEYHYFCAICETEIHAESYQSDNHDGHCCGDCVKDEIKAEKKPTAEVRDYIYDNSYVATFDGYDGAPIDADTPSDDLIGNGNTEQEAIDDLLEQELERRRVKC